jgi:hypothetical protein
MQVRAGSFNVRFGIGSKTSLRQRRRGDEYLRARRQHGCQKSQACSSGSCEHYPAHTPIVDCRSTRRINRVAMDIKNCASIPWNNL